jgi:hypothetical protein
MLSGYAAHDHRAFPERQRRLDSGSLPVPSGTGRKGYMATSRQLRSEDLSAVRGALERVP